MLFEPVAEAHVFGDPSDMVVNSDFPLPPVYMTKTDAKLGQEMADSMRTPLKPGDSRRHHFIPQFFLRRFADGDALVRVPLSYPEQHHIATVKDLAVVKDLYTTVDGDPRVGETIATERLLARIDDDAVKPLKCLAAGLIFTLHQPERQTLALWLAMLSVRGPGLRRQLEAMTDLWNKYRMVHSHLEKHRFSRAVVETELKKRVEWFRDKEVVAHQNDYIRSMLNVGGDFAVYIQSRRWLLVKFTRRRLFLSDNPVVNLPSSISVLWGDTNNSGNTKCVPIDGSTALIIHNNMEFPETTIIDPQSLSADCLNQILVNQAAQEIYCHPKDVEGIQQLRFPNPDGQELLKVSGVHPIAGTVDGVNAPPRRKGHRRYRKSQERVP